MIKMQWASQLQMTHTFLPADLICILFFLQRMSSAVSRGGGGGQTVAQTTRNCILTRFDAVDNLRIVTLVFVQSSDLKHSRANSGRFKDTARVRRAYKPGCIVVSVIHIDNNTHKVPLDRDVLVSDLGRQNFQTGQHNMNKTYIFKKKA